METLNYTEEQSLEMFDLMADLHKAKELEKQAWEEYQQAYKKAEALQQVATKLEIKIDRINEKIRLQDCPYKQGQKFAVADEIYDQIKISYVSAYFTKDIKIRFVGRRKATKGWEKKSKDTTVENLNAFIICEL
jgi:hypothetical protein